MRRYLTAVAVGAVLLVGSACGTDSEPEDSPTDIACSEYNRLINERSQSYGEEMGAVGQAVAAGDEDRKETAIAVVQELFQTTAEGLRAIDTDGLTDEFVTALSDAADGLDSVAGQIETYEDVAAADGLMSESQFATAGAKISELCAAEG